MKFHLQIILFLVVFSFSYSQKNNEFEKLKKYNRYEVIINPKSKFILTYKYKLKNGYITQQEYYVRKQLTYKCNYLYDTLNNIQHTIELFNRNEGYKNDSIVKKEIDLVTNENMKALFTELSVEPIRTDGEISQGYVSSIIARLREVSVSRAIADLKSSLQRLNPVENEAEYNAAFATLVSLESTRRGLHDLAVGGL